MNRGELYYRVLGLPPDATAAQVKQAYRCLAKQWHPDRFSTDPGQQQTAASRFQEINAAYEWIKAQGNAPPTPEPAPTRSTKVSSQPIDPNFYYDLAMAAIQKGEDEGAIAHLTQAIHLNPDDQRAYQCRAFLNEKLGFQNRAMADFRRAAELKAAQADQAPSEPSPPSTNPSLLWQARPPFTTPEPIMALALDPTGQALAGGLSGGEVWVWNAATGSREQTLRGHRRDVVQVAWHPQGEILASFSSDGTVKLWQMTKGELLTTIQAHEQPLLSGTFSQDGAYFVTGSRDRTVKIWQTQPPRLLKTLKGYGADVSAIAPCATAALFASGGLEPHIRLRDYAHGKIKRSIKSNGGVLNLEFSRNGQYLAAGGYNTIAQVWNLARDQPPLTLVGHSLRITTLAFSPDNLHLATGGWDKTIMIWNIATGKAIATLTGHHDTISGLVFNPQGDQLYSSSWDRTIRCWQRQS
ncbi:DnaJ domain-containing protein [Spirulina sp. CCNP1310]|uniref:WD40 domain-containing protein n=1 Tax=Spirulina sp. CCNP1310 TaxID=3110249 RepID=UPI002B1F7332|nr:DnaJ domain-containing protein [Spirulina sp. CCNP1310]MEA5419965.1 DnaJ domain-containing protein [Spirulina sp. CCNP1310]